MVMVNGVVILNAEGVSEQAYTEPAGRPYIKSSYMIPGKDGKLVHVGLDLTTVPGGAAILLLQAKSKADDIVSALYKKYADNKGGKARTEILSIIQNTLRDFQLKSAMQGKDTVISVYKFDTKVAVLKVGPKGGITYESLSDEKFMQMAYAQLNELSLTLFRKVTHSTGEYADAIKELFSNASIPESTDNFIYKIIPLTDAEQAAVAKDLNVTNKAYKVEITSKKTNKVACVFQYGLDLNKRSIKNFLVSEIVIPGVGVITSTMVMAPVK